MEELTSLLSIMVVRNASDLYLNNEAPPTLKVDGQYQPLSAPALTKEHVENIAFGVLTPQQKEQFERDMELDFGLEYPSIGRFRLNLYHQKGSVAIVARFIKDECPSIVELGLPEVMQELAMEEHGLVLVVGSTGAGKSTAVSSMIDYRNEHRSGHILTIEDPIEYTHHHKQSLISQREIGIDTHSYEAALKFALREAPDCIMIGEIRDHNTAMQALRFAETGHLCISTMHATNTSQALSRFRNLFAPGTQERTLQDLSQHLRGIIGLRMARDTQGKRHPVAEVLLNNAYITELIQENKLNEIKDALNESGDGCQTFDESLLQLLQQDKITHTEAMRLADSKIDFNLKSIEDNYTNPQAVFLVEKHWINKKSAFDGCHSFMVIANRKQQQADPQAAQLLQEAIEFSLTTRGFKLDQHSPEMRVQFAFEKKPETTDASALSESGLIIVGRESQNNTILFQFTISFVMDLAIHTQEDINTQIANILSALPLHKSTVQT